MSILVFGGSGFIGRAICEKLEDRGSSYIIADIENRTHDDMFEFCDVTSFEQTFNLIAKYRPRTIINLAARTDDRGKSIQEYSVNYLSVANIIKALNVSENSGCQIFHFSTQYVIGPDAKVSGEFEYDPYTTYGESKMVAEMILTISNCNWTIFRPTAVWGAYHPGYPKTIWPLISKKIFIQPNTDPLRSYIYVDKLADAFLKITEKPKDIIKGHVYYLGNRPKSQRMLFKEWEEYIEGGKSWTIPKVIFELIYQVARVFEFLGIAFPLNKTRYEIFTKNYPVDLGSTHELIGEIPEPEERDFQRTFSWYKGLI